MNTKRGMFLVVLVIVLMLVLTESGLALEKYVALKHWEDYDDYFECDAIGKRDVYTCATKCDMDCDEGDYETNVGDKGCVFNVEENDEGDNACSYAEVEEGFILNQVEENNNIFNHNVEYAQGFMGTVAGDDAACLLQYGNYVTDSDVSYICGQNHYWYACVPDSEGQVIWVNKILYNCTKSSYEEGEQYTWKEIDKDYDYDGYIEGQEDCMNVPSDKEVCPVPNV